MGISWVANGDSAAACRLLRFSSELARFSCSLCAPPPPPPPPLPPLSSKSAIEAGFIPKRRKRLATAVVDSEGGTDSFLGVVTRCVVACIDCRRRLSRLADLSRDWSASSDW